MEHGLILFTQFFTTLTATLAVWGAFISYYLLVQIASVKQRNRNQQIRRSDIGCLAAIIPLTTWLFACLFVFPQYTSDHMYSIFVFEFWYVTFAIYYTIQLFPTRKIDQ